MPSPATGSTRGCFYQLIMEVEMIDTVISVVASQASQTGLPKGFHMRPAAMEDLGEAVRVMNAWSSQVLGRNKFVLDDIRREWQEPGYDLESDSRIVVDPQGRIVGFQEVFDPGYPHVRIYCWGVVDPRFTDLGLEAQLLNWAEERARQSVEAAPPNARVALVTHCLSSQNDTVELLQRSGFNFQRHSLRMVLEISGRPELPVWPEGITVRSMQAGREERAVVEAVRDAFRDHWGFVESPFEDEFARWSHLMEDNPDFDPELWFLALDGERIAGFSLCWPKSRDEIEMGWVGTLGVRRPWRRQGLALALLQHSFVEFWKRGKQKVGLGVDAQSLTGATRLYHRAGMHSDPERQISIFEKELRPGEELSTQSIDI